MRCDSKALIEAVVLGLVSPNAIVEGKYASLGFYLTVDAKEAKKAVAKLQKAKVDLELMAKTPIPGVQALAFPSKAVRDKAAKLLGR